MRDEQASESPPDVRNGQYAGVTAARVLATASRQKREPTGARSCGVWKRRSGSRGHRLTYASRPGMRDSLVAAPGLPGWNEQISEDDHGAETAAIAGRASAPAPSAVIASWTSGRSGRGYVRRLRSRIAKQEREPIVSENAR
jgi:hypothetical protein